LTGTLATDIFQGRSLAGQGSIADIC